MELVWKGSAEMGFVYVLVSALSILRVFACHKALQLQDAQQLTFERQNFGICLFL